MICTRAVARFVIPFLICVPTFCQASGPKQQAVPFGRRGLNPDDESGVLRTKLWSYQKAVDRGSNNVAAQGAFQIAGIYERQGNYVDAATWYRTAYAKGLLEGSKGFIDLILLNKVTVDNPETVRPFIEVRAICGSHIAQQYLLDHWHEASAQIPLPTGPQITECSPVGPGDRMERNLAAAARLRQNQQQMAEFYRLHPNEDPNVKALQAEGAVALVLGALIITAAAMPASGPGSVACNRYRNNLPGAYDASVCNVPPPK